MSVLLIPTVIGAAAGAWLSTVTPPDALRRVFAVVLLLPLPDGMTPEGLRVAAVAVLMATWWISGAIPIPATALLPIALFPILGALNMVDTTAPFANKVIYLFLGGFVVAFAMQRWNLHRRIALNVLQHAGGSGRLLVAGFLFASALISMWVMNTSTAMMLTPVAISVIGVIHASIKELDDRAREDFQYALLLAVAYGSTIGGLTTLVGTLPTAMLAAFMLESYGTSVGFVNWMMVGVPLAVITLPLCWLALTRWVFKVRFKTSGEGQAELRKLRQELGPIRKPEIRIAVVAGLMILQSVGVSISGLLAFGGIGGIAVGFAAKDTLANLFAGVFILADAPYQLGDFILLDDGLRGELQRAISTRLLSPPDSS